MYTPGNAICWSATMAYAATAIAKGHQRLAVVT
jgi:hypothetical protein